MDLVPMNESEQKLERLHSLESCGEQGTTAKSQADRSSIN